MQFKFRILILFLSLNLFGQDNSFFDCRSSFGNISYMYAPGFLSTESSMVKYCPYFTSWTGEKFESKSGGHILGHPYTVVNFSEILLNPNAKSIFDYKLNLSETDLGQQKDIQCVYNSYKKHLNLYNDSNIIMHGHSRGAAAIFNFIAEYKPTNVKAAILEGIFDDMQHNIKHFTHGKNLFFERILNKTLNFLISSYNGKGLAVKDYLKKFTKEVPLLFVTSLKETVACPQGVLNLYIDLKIRKFKKIHLLILDNACHSSYMTNNEKDREKYELCVHAFYKHYNLPYNQAKAKSGKKIFNETRPEITELEKYNLPLCECCLLKTIQKIK